MNKAFQSVKESGCDYVKLGKNSSVRTDRTNCKMAITDRTNRTAREKHLRINKVNKVYQSVEESVCHQVTALKTRRSARIDCTDRTN